MSMGSVTALCPPPPERGQFLPTFWGHPLSSHPSSYSSPGPEGENHPGQLCLARAPMAAARRAWGNSPSTGVKPQPAKGLPTPSWARLGAV